MDGVSDDTLPDDAWKDSFDKLLDQRPVLREMNVIKRDVRASFNMNSSYENSSYENSALRDDMGQQPQPKRSLSPSTLSLNFQYLQVPKDISETMKNKKRLTTDVSTPIRSNTTSNPFKCTLSPIGSWELKNFQGKKKNNKESNKLAFNATPVNNNVIVTVENCENKSSPTVERDLNNTRNSHDISPLVLVRKKWKSKQAQKQVCFASKETDENNIDILSRDSRKSRATLVNLELHLQPGKWRKSLNCLRRSHHPVIENDVRRKTLIRNSTKGRSTETINKRSSLTTVSVAGNRKSIYIRPNSVQTRIESRSTYSLGCNDFKRQVLQRCGQRRILNFDITYNEQYLENCYKIGEGAFGEVFVHSAPKNRYADESAEKTVLKIIPIEGKELVNGEVQKTFEQILPEIIISMELSNLSFDKRERNITSGFVNLQKVKCVKGKYPSHLQKLWEEYDLEKESENDHPKCFTSNQIYIILELGFGGQDLEAYQFKNAEQSFYALQQIILTLAVAENEFQFEHRDLHWGNVLVLNTNRPNIAYRLGDETLTIPTKGVQITIIDYTLSRMTFNDYCFFNDLSNDEELFCATGDYQFEIYRIMRKILNNKWESFEPKTNIYWISYIITKMVDGVVYKNVRSKIHLQYLDRLKKLQKSILTYNSCVECARDVNIF